MPSLLELTDRAFIIAHREDTTQLEAVLTAQGFRVRVIRGPYSAEQSQYSAQMKCLVNHANAWRAIVEEDLPAIVVEADFVPVTEFSKRPAPSPPLDEAGAGFAWLYSAGSILYGFDRHGFPHGHGNTTVAYLVSPTVADLLIDFCLRESMKTAGGQYCQWETYLGIFLRKEHDVLNYIPTYQFGEHGGLPNKEHKTHGIRAWHQADNLIGELAFQPNYAQGSRARQLYYRARAIGRGWVRLLLLRFYDPRYVNSNTTRGRFAMAWFSVSRLLFVPHRRARLRPPSN